MQDAAGPPPAAGAGPQSPDVVAPRGPTPADVVRIALWTGLVAGALEAGVVAIRVFAMDRLTQINPHAVWIVPTLQAAFFVTLGLAAAMVVRVVRRPMAARAAIIALFALGVASVLFRFAPELSRKASLVLGAGAGFQCARVVAARTASFVAAVRRTTPWIAAAVAVAAIAMDVAPRVAESRALGAVAAAPPDAPNVLLLVFDTARAQSASVSGCSRETTPELKKLAARGTNFLRAVTPAPWTLPTHASLFTGQPAHTIEAGWVHPLGPEHRTLAEVLAARGWATAGFVANVEYCAAETGLARGFVRYEDYRPHLLDPRATPALLGGLLIRIHDARGGIDPPARIRAPDVNRAFLEWKAKLGGRPYLAVINYYDAHEPYVPPEPFGSMFGPTRPPQDGPWARRPTGSYDAETIASFRARYEGGIAYADHHAGALLETLRAEGGLDRTLVVATADHGEEFEEHGVLLHSASLYMPSLHVPLIVSFPGRVAEGRVVEAPVGVVDVGATVLDLLGIDARAERFGGTSFAASLAAGGPAPAEPILSHVGTHAARPQWWPAGPGALDSIVLDGFHYIRRRTDGHEELYHWVADPWEATDLVTSPEHAATLERCRAALRERVGDAR